MASQSLLSLIMEEIDKAELQQKTIQNNKKQFDINMEMANEIIDNYYKQEKQQEVEEDKRFTTCPLFPPGKTVQRDLQKGNVDEIQLESPGLGNQILLPQLNPYQNQQQGIINFNNNKQLIKEQESEQDSNSEEDTVIKVANFGQESQPQNPQNDENSDDSSDTVIKSPTQNNSDKQDKEFGKFSQQKTMTNKVSVNEVYKNVEVKKEANYLLNLFKDDPLVRLEMLNKGAYGKVFKGVWALKEEFVAIKYVEYMGKNDIDYKSGYKEANTMTLIQAHIPKEFHNHYSFLNFLREKKEMIDEDISEKNYLMLVCDYGNCSLQDIINYRRDEQKPWNTKSLVHIFREIVEAFYQLTLPPLHMYHRDIKPGNIVFSKPKLQFMIIDFGEAESNVESKKATYQYLDIILRGTPRYLDPILYKYYRYCYCQPHELNEEQWNELPEAQTHFSYEKADVYSLAQTFLEMIDLDWTYDQRPTHTFIRKRLHILKKYKLYPDLAPLIKEMMELDQKKRISLRELRRKLRVLDGKKNKNLNMQKLYETDCNVAQRKNNQIEKEIKKKNIIDIQNLVQQYESCNMYEKAIYFQKIILRKLKAQNIKKANYFPTEQIAEAKQKLGTYYKLYNQFSSALECFQEACDFYTSEGMHQKIQDMNIHNDMVYCNEKLGNNKKADNIRRESLKLNSDKILNQFGNNNNKSKSKRNSYLPIVEEEQQDNNSKKRFQRKSTMDAKDKSQFGNKKLNSQLQNINTRDFKAKSAMNMKQLLSEEKLKNKYRK